jgi:16S rRNA processing protein RimM
MDRDDPDLVCLACVATAHGVRGHVRLRCFTERPEDALAYGPLIGRRDGRSYDIKLVGSAKDGLLAHIMGVDDRDAALALRGVELCVPRSALPEPSEDEFYITDLIGLDARLPDGRRFGTVRQCANFGAGDVLDVVTDDGRLVSLPFDSATVPSVDLAARQIVVEPPRGLFGEPQ